MQGVLFYIGVYINVYKMWKQVQDHKNAMIKVMKLRLTVVKVESLSLTLIPTVIDCGLFVLNDADNEYYYNYASTFKINTL